MYLVSLIDTQLDNTLDTHLSVTACSVLQQHGAHIADVKPIRSALCKREKSQHTHTHTRHNQEKWILPWLCQAIPTETKRTHEALHAFSHRSILQWSMMRQEALADAAGARR